METILEQQRRLHEERERVVDSMVKETLHKKSTVSFKMRRNVTKLLNFAPSVFLVLVLF